MNGNGKEEASRAIEIDVDDTIYYKPKPSRLPETPKLEVTMYVPPRSAPFIVDDFRGSDAYNPNPH